MPSYTYQVIRDDGTEGAVFEVIHGMQDPPLTQHPETGEQVVRIFQAPHVAGSSHERQSKQMLRDSNVERLGFTKYVRNGKGHYEKRAGQGPNQISAD